jgi:Tfp pilus assembly protein PilN
MEIITYDLGLGLEAITLDHVPPRDPPPGGSQWQPDLDVPGVEVTVCLPVHHRSGHLDPRLCQHGQLLGQQLNEIWGIPDGFIRRASRTHRAATARLSSESALSAAIQELEELRRHVEARAERLDQRERTIAAWHGVAQEPTPAEAAAGTRTRTCMLHALRAEATSYEVAQIISSNRDVLATVSLPAGSSWRDVLRLGYVTAQAMGLSVTKAAIISSDPAATQDATTSTVRGAVLASLVGAS